MVWLVSFMLQALGTIWVFITIIAAIAIAISVQQAGSISVSSEYAQLATAFVNATAVSYLVALVLSLLIGLAFIALGQMLAMLVRIETNTRIRKQAGESDARLDPVDGPWSQPPTARRGVVRKPESDEYAPPRPRR